jgi:hypothetical protein
LSQRSLGGFPHERLAFVVRVSLAARFALSVSVRRSRAEGIGLRRAVSASAHYVNGDSRGV